MATGIVKVSLCPVYVHILHHWCSVMKPKRQFRSQPSVRVLTHVNIFSKKVPKVMEAVIRSDVVQQNVAATLLHFSTTVPARETSSDREPSSSKVVTRYTIFTMRGQQHNRRHKAALLVCYTPNKFVEPWSNDTG